MAETSYSYTISTQFPNGAVNGVTLAQQCTTAGIPAPIRVDTDGDTCFIVFDPALTDADKGALDGQANQTPNPATPIPTGSVIGDHAGTPSYSSVLYASTKLVEDTLVITLDASWQVLGRAISNPGFFNPSPRLFANVVSITKADNTGGQAQLQLVEDAGEVINGVRIYNGVNDRVLNTTPYDVPASSDWQEAGFSSDTTLTTANRCEYRLEGRLNGALSCSVLVAEGGLVDLL